MTISEDLTYAILALASGRVRDVTHHVVKVGGA